MSFENQTSSTNVNIDTTGLAVAEYTLVLESFDADSDGVKSTLKIDTVTINVISRAAVGCPVATFTETLQVLTIVSGEKSEWTLPTIESCDRTLQKVTVQPDSILANYITYDDKSSKISYEGSLIQGASTQNRYAKIGITLTNSAGSTPYEQSLIVFFPSQDTKIQPDASVDDSETNDPVIEGE